MGFLKGADVRLMLGISRLTLYRYVQEGKLHPVKMTRKIYMYDEEEVYRFVGGGRDPNTDVVIYARVNAKNQKQELDDQILRLTEFANSNGMAITNTYWDCCPSMEFSRSERRGLHALLLAATRRKVGVVIVESPDRIAAIGHEMFAAMLSNYRIRILYMSMGSYNPRYQAESVSEITAIIKKMSLEINKKRPPKDEGANLA